MRAWEVRALGPIDGSPMVLVDRPPPEPAPGQVRVRVSVCGVCRTDLHVAEGARVHVLTRGHQARQLALELGAASAGDTADAPPEPLDAAILFAPVGDLVPVALRALAPGATLAIAGIHLTDIPPLTYADHLFQERAVCSVTANTRRDGEEFLALAARIGIEVTTTPFALDDADRALRALARGEVRGAAVLRVDP